MGGPILRSPGLTKLLGAFVRSPPVGDKNPHASPRVESPQSAPSANQDRRMDGATEARIATHREDDRLPPVLRDGSGTGV